METFNHYSTKAMKKIIVLAIVVIAAFIVAVFSIFRYPGYTIQAGGQIMVLNKLSSSVSIFNLQTGGQTALIKLDYQPHETVTSQNGEFAIAANYGSNDKPGRHITFINFKTHLVDNVIDLGENTFPHGLANIPGENKILVTTEGKNGIMLVNTQTGIVEKLIPIAEKMPHMVVVHPNGQIAYVTNYLSNTVSEINIADGVVVQSIFCGKGPEGIDISPDGNELWITDKLDNTVSIVDTRTMLVSGVLKTDKVPVRSKFTIDGRYCLVSNANAGNISVFDVVKKTLVKVIALPGNRNIIDKLVHSTPRPVGITMHPDGQYVFISDSNADKVLIIDLEKWKLVSDLSTGRIPDGIAFSKN